jgi:hypothetical protein
MFSPLLVLADPIEVFRRVESSSPWIGPLIYCTLGLFVITWLGGCWETIADGLRWWSLIGPAVFAPLVVGITGLGSATVLYLVQRIASKPGSNGPQYRTILSLNSHCAIILILGEVVNFLLVHADVVQNLTLPLTNRFPLGLDLLLLGAKEPNIYLSILLHSTSVFVIWYFVVLAKGLRYLIGTSLARSTTPVAVLWLVGVMIAVGGVYGAGGATVFRIVM